MLNFKSMKNKKNINFLKKAKALLVLNSNNPIVPVKKRTIVQSICIGLKKGWETPTLPDNILKLQLHPLIRIIRFLGGSSLLLILSKKYLNYNIYVLYFCMFCVAIFTIYHFIITFYRIKHAIKLFKIKELDVRNSPIDR